MQRRLALAPQLLGLIGLPHAFALDHIALHHPFGLGDGIGIHGLGLDQIDGRALQRAGHADLVGLAGKNHRIEGADRHKLGPHRRAAIDGDRDFLARMALAHDVALAARHHVDRGILLIVAERHAVHRDGVAAAGHPGRPDQVAARAEYARAILVGMHDDGQDIGDALDIAGRDHRLLHRRLGALDMVGGDRVAVGVENLVLDILIFTDAEQPGGALRRGVEVGIHAGVGIVLDILRHQRLGAVESLGDGGHLDHRVDFVGYRMDLVAEPIECCPQAFQRLNAPRLSAVRCFAHFRVTPYR